MRSLPKLAALAVLLLSVVTATAGPLEDGLAAIKAQNFARAVTLLEPLAAAGNVEAEYHLGVLYKGAKGFKPDYQKAVALLTQAADKNDARAQFELGSLYSLGWGVAADREKAYALYRKAADQRYAPAEYEIAGYYTGGSGSAWDVEEAFHWHRRSCEDGYKVGCFLLGEMYEWGMGTSPNPVEATHWYYESLTSTHEIDPLLGIGRLGAAGDLVGSDASTNKEIAFAALSLAHEFRGHLVPSAQKDPQNALTLLLARLTPDEFARAKARLELAKTGGTDKWTKANGCVLVDILMMPSDAIAGEDCTRLAALGVPVAEYNLGWMNLTGYRIPQNSGAALKWFSLAADADFAAAELALGKEMSTGARLPKDLVAALGWFLVAEPRLPLAGLAEIYHEDALKGIEGLRSQLTSTEQAKARAWADQWNAAHPMRPSPETRELNEAGISLLKQNNMWAAIEKFDAVLKIDPDFFEAHLYRGRAEMQLNLSSRARADIEVALSLEPKTMLARFTLGQLKFADRDYKGALADFDAVLVQNPNFVYAIASRGSAHAMLGEFSEAADDTARAIQLNPGFAYLRSGLASNLFRARRFDEAAAEYHTLAADVKAVNAAYNMLFEYIAVEHSGKDGATGLAANEKRLPNHQWPYPVFQYFLGKIDRNGLVAATKDSRELCEAKYYIGEHMYLGGEKTSAKALFKDVAQHCSDQLEEQWRARWYWLSDGGQ